MHYGLESLKFEGMLAVEITEKESKQILRIKQSLGFMRLGMHKRYFKTFPSYLGFRVASTAVFIPLISGMSR